MMRTVFIRVCHTSAANAADHKKVGLLLPAMHNWVEHMHGRLHCNRVVGGQWWCSGCHLIKLHLTSTAESSLASSGTWHVGFDQWTTD